MTRNELIFKPSPFIELMKNGLTSAHVDIFWSVLTQPAIDHLFSEQLPTPDKVWAVIVLDESVTAPRQERLDCLYFLQQFVTKLDSDDLQFMTNSTIMPETIKIMFTSVTGLQRRPIAHTCSNTLELPNTYTSEQDLKREFRSIL
jgi:hypothetical protein